MYSRRTFLGLSAATAATAALAVPALSGLGARAWAATPDTFTLGFDNQSGSGTVYAYVTGTTPDGRVVFIAADGSPYYPASPSSTLTPLAVDCAIPVGNGGQVTVPKMSGARIYLVLNDKLDFFLNPGPAVVHPSFLNTGDSNFTKQWSFAEFTFNDTQLFANISYVDFVGVPLGLALTAASGNQSVQGLPAGSADTVANELNGVGGAWGQLVQTGSDGRVLRVLCPQHRADQFSGYLDGYIDQVWQKYSSTTLTVDSQNPGVGVFTGTVSGDTLTFNNGETFAKPVTADVWSCNSGPFANQGSPARLAIIPRLAAALNRTTLLDNPNQPTGEDPAKFYQYPQTNHYARIVHSHLPNNRGYAFPYDDVTPGPDFSGSVFAGDPQTLTVTVHATHA